MPILFVLFIIISEHLIHFLLHRLVSFYYRIGRHWRQWDEYLFLLLLLMTEIGEEMIVMDNIIHTIIITIVAIATQLCRRLRNKNWVRIVIVIIMLIALITHIVHEFHQR